MCTVKNNLEDLNLFNPIRAGGGGPIGPQLVFFYTHFSCVRARYLKFYDFLNNVKVNLVKKSFVEKIIFAATWLGYKMVKKKLLSILEL